MNFPFVSAYWIFISFAVFPRRPGHCNANDEHDQKGDEKSF